MTDKKEYAFFEGKFVPIEEAKISVKTHALQYGTGVFEGIRAYWSEKDQEMYVFRMREHFERLADSMKILRLTCKYSADELCKLAVELLKKNEANSDTYLRPFVYASSLKIGPGVHDSPMDFSMYAVPFGAYFGSDDGLKVAVSSWRRLEDNAIPARAKVSGAYANTALAKTDAVLSGFHDAIVLSEDGHVAEGSAMNIFLVKNGNLYTTESTDNILVGITRGSVIEIAKNELQLTPFQRKIDRTELYIADEMFFCGTGAEVTPVVEVDKRTIGDGKIGPITKAIKDFYFNVTHGEDKKYRHWLTPVYAGAESKISAR